MAIWQSSKPELWRASAERMFDECVQIIKARHKRDKPGYVYFIGNEHAGPIKVGFSTKPSYRLRTIQTGQAQPMSLLVLMQGSRFVESRLHQYLSDLQEHGEWFRRDDPLISFLQLLEERATWTAKPAVPKCKPAEITEENRWFWDLLTEGQKRRKPAQNNG